MLQRRLLLAVVIAVSCCIIAAHATDNVVDATLDTVSIAADISVLSGVDNSTDSTNQTVHYTKPSFVPSNEYSKSKSQTLQEIYEENEWKNSLILWILPDSIREAMPHWAQSWCRCWLMALVLYFGVGGLWAYYCYYCFGDKLYPPGHIPGLQDMIEQMKVAFFAMPLYAGLPAATEFIVEQGWTIAYSRVSDVGLPKYCLYFALYMTSVEFFVYWQHRLLHDIRIGYRTLHHIHHKYNKEHTLSPFAGLAFHPIDGILQALPYSWTLFFVPMHFLTHEMLLFATAIWTTNIHDCIHVRVDPIMGAGYHTIHHTTYKENYGHYFTYMDRIFNTLITPEDYEVKLRDSLSKTD